jgi:predicted TIM-barrel fold metal-dependent hydrolase
MKKIDIHCHTTNRKLSHLTVESAKPDDIISYMKKYDIEKTVLMATYFPTTGSGISNFRLLRWIEDKPEFYMFGSLDFEHYFKQGMNEIEELRGTECFKGVKVYLGYQNIDPSSEKFKDLVSFAEDSGLPLMFHTGYTRFNEYGIKRFMPKAPNPKSLDKIIGENPNVHFVISHLARPFNKELISLVNHNSNVSADTSGLISSVSDRHEIPLCANMVKEFLYKCGSEKLLFGTDFPVQTHEDSIRIAQRGMEDLSESEKENVYYKNAKKLLNI